jgi:hypothetical protein
MIRIDNGAAATEERIRKKEKKGRGPSWHAASHASSFDVTESYHVRRHDSCGVTQST